jgi:topoisomerase IV subunit A
VTIILSDKGWIRAAKGYEINTENLNFKTGDQLKTVTTGRSNQMLVVLDSSGRSYSMPIRGLPSARGHGEPLTGKLTIPPAITFEWIAAGESDQRVILSSSIGYGYISKMSDLYCKNRAGKSILTFPDNAQPMPIIHVNDIKTDLLVAISNEGRMLVFPVAQLPVLARGKGNKVIQVFTDKGESLTLIGILPANHRLILHTAKQSMTLRPENLVGYIGDRGRRGQKLPKGYRDIKSLETKEITLMI